MVKELEETNNKYSILFKDSKNKEYSTISLNSSQNNNIYINEKNDK